ncbi:Non-specific serine/threonine protein kinase [Altererythrobacter insulae]|nr:Non-specific serine/threonine protein kinase [Altererythrobacter insulae]
MLLRDVNNITTYYAQFAPNLALTKFGEEMWALYEAGELTDITKLTGQFKEDTHSADVETVLAEIQAAFEQEQDRLAYLKEAAEQ